MVRFIIVEELVEKKKIQLQRKSSFLIVNLTIFLFFFSFCNNKWDSIAPLGYCFVLLPSFLCKNKKKIEIEIMGYISICEIR